MLLYLARISAKKQKQLLDLFHRSNMQVELFFVYLAKLIGETYKTEMFGKNACVVVLFNNNRMSM